MDIERVLKYIAAACFVIALPICMMPLLKIAGYELSLLDFASMSGDFDNFLAQFGEFTEFIREELASYRFVCIVIMVIPVCAAIATALLKGNGVVFSAVAGSIADMTAGAVFADKANAVFDYVNDSLIGTLFDIQLHLENVPVCLWVILHAAIIVIVLVYTIMRYKRKNAGKEKLDMGNIIFTDVKIGNDKEPEAEYVKKVVVLDNDIDNSDDIFFGAIVCLRGRYMDKVFLMKKDELVSFGSEETDDIFIIGALAKKTHCIIAYDRDNSEYMVEPLEKNAVFLENGQPLGVGRSYSIPRGMTLMIDSGKNRFRLG